MSYIIISAFTQHPVYVEKALCLATSLNNLDLPYEMTEMEEQGSWEKNCQQKAVIILEALRRHRKPVVWIDADAVIMRKPELFERLSQDICDVAYYAMKSPNRHLASGTLFFGYTQGAISILEQWISRCENSMAFDQKLLEQVLWNEFQIPKRCYDIIEMPVEYCRIFDNKEQESEMTTAPVVIHTQASRVVRKKINIKGLEHKSILICGNGGSLPEHIKKVDMDKFEYVCRLNNYSTRLDVGERTDIWATSFWYDIPLNQIVKNQQKIIWDTMMFGKVFQYKPEWKRAVLNTLGRPPDRMMQKNEFETLRLKSSITSPSTGLSVIYMAQMLNMKITLAGFNFFSKDVPHHYYNVLDIKQGPHNGDLEKNYILYLKEIGVLDVIQ